MRITRLQARDVVVAQPGGVLVRMPELWQVYSDTADRADYQALVSELQAPAADLSGKPSPRAAAVAYSRARKEIARLPRVAVRFARPSDPELAYGSNVLVAAWRDVGLGAYVGKGTPDATFERWFPTSSLRPARPGDPDRVGRRRAPRLCARQRLARERPRRGRLPRSYVPGPPPTPVMSKRAVATAGASTPFG